MHAARRSDRPKKNSLLITYGSDELTGLTLKACLIARDATFNLLDFLRKSSRMAFLAIRDCEKELDQIERYIDEQMPAAITQVSESKARQLLSSLKAITDLERIGDLVLGVAQRLQSRPELLARSAVEGLGQMTAIVHDMLEQIHEGFVSLDIECARKVLRADTDIDRIYRSLFKERLSGSTEQQDPFRFEILLMAQALERAGDHATNLAEELVSLIEGHTARHPPKRKLSP
jgi:phosphate transport system protein